MSDTIKPIRRQSIFQSVALSRGYTVKAGKATRERLTRSPRRPVEVTIVPIDVRVSAEPMNAGDDNAQDIED